MTTLSRTTVRRGGAGLVAALLIASWIALAPAASASESIGRFRVDALLSSVGTLEITETIAYDFDLEERRGIIRDIPVADRLEDGRTVNYTVEVDGITANGQPVDWTIDSTYPYLSLRIGDPDVFVSGEVTYQIDYTVTGAVRRLTAEDVAGATEPGLSVGDVELYWDFIGDEWEVPIAEGVASVRGPGAPVAALCFAGPAGSTAGCPVALGSDAVRLGPAYLLPGYSLTGVVAFPAAAFTSVPEPDIREAPASQNLGAALGVGIPIGLVTAIGFIGGAAVLRRRAAGVVNEITPVRYGPPDGLRPAEISAALEGKLDSTALIATLLDLVARRQVTVSLDEGGFLSRSQLRVGRWGNPDDQLADWESRIVDEILGQSDSAVLDGYDSSLATTVTRVASSLTSQAQMAGRRNPRGDRIRRRLNRIGTGGLVLVMASFIIGTYFDDVRFIGIGVPLGIALVVGAWVARAITPRRETAQSAAFAAEVAGFRRFLDTDPAEARRDLAKRLNLPDHAVFATMLPYAVVLGLEDRWIGAFPDLTGEDLQRMGYFVPSIYSVNTLVSRGTSSVSSAVTAPSRSSSSGFSSGGGFSGGGGGGGGGRSW